MWSLKPTIPARSSINPLKMVQTHQNCNQRIVDNLSFPSMIVESQISPKPLAKCLVLKFFHQSFLSPNVYDRATWRDVINGHSMLTSQWQFALSRSGHSASRVAWWEDPWVHLTLTKRAKTSCQHRSIYTAKQSSSSSSWSNFAAFQKPLHFQNKPFRVFKMVLFRITYRLLFSFYCCCSEWACKKLHFRSIQSLFLVRCKELWLCTNERFRMHNGLARNCGYVQMDDLGCTVDSQGIVVMLE